MGTISRAAFCAVMACALVLGGTRQAGAQDAERTAKDRMEDIYLQLVRANQLRDDSNRTGALTLYEDTLRQLESLEADYPGWYPQIVRQRILYCMDEIARLRAGAPPPEPQADSPPRTAPARPAGVAAADGGGALLAEALRARIAELEQQVDELSGRNRALERQARRPSRAEAGRGAAGAGPTVGPLLAGLVRAKASELLSAGKAAEAVALLDEAAEVLAGDPGLTLLGAIALCQTRDFVRAISLLEPLTRGRGAPAEAFMTLGVARMGLGRMGEARAAMEQALELDSSLADAHYNLAEILLQLDRPDVTLARAHYQQAIDLGGQRDARLEESIRQMALRQRAAALR